MRPRLAGFASEPVAPLTPRALLQRLVRTGSGGQTGQAIQTGAEKIMVSGPVGLFGLRRVRFDRESGVRAFPV